MGRRKKLDKPPVIDSVIQEQGFPPPPLRMKERLDYRMSQEEIVEQCSEKDNSYPNLSFNKEVYLRISSTPRYYPSRLHTIKKYRLIGNQRLGLYPFSREFLFRLHVAYVPYLEYFFIESAQVTNIIQGRGYCSWVIVLSHRGIDMFTEWDRLILTLSNVLLLV